MSYVARIVKSLQERLPDCEPDLIRYYALLALVRGMDVTEEDVHDAWAVWRDETHPGHGSLVPFDELSPDMQAMDTPYAKVVGGLRSDVGRLKVCCDLHNSHCEPPSELCCGQCGEATHPLHHDGSECVPAAVALRAQVERWRRELTAVALVARRTADEDDRLGAEIARLNGKLDQSTVCAFDGCSLPNATMHCHGDNHGYCCVESVYVVQDSGVAVHRDHLPAALHAELERLKAELDAIRAVDALGPQLWTPARPGATPGGLLPGATVTPLEAPPLTDLVGIDPGFTGGLSAKAYLREQTEAERKVIEAAKAWREWHATILTDGGMFIPEHNLIAAVDALGAGEAVDRG